MLRDASRLHGRERELATVSLELDAAFDGEPRILLLHGEAGVGKTALMEAAAHAVTDRANVLTARNLPLTTRVPNLAVRALLAQAEAGHPPRNDIHPPLPALPLRLDEAIGRLTTAGPVVVAIDDLQWADADTLDALMFLAGGAEDRPLAILATVRSGAGRAVDRWRADLLRLPGARSVEVRPLDRLGMHELITALLGAPPHDALVGDVLARTGGNPYHAQLLLEGVDPTALAAPSPTSPATSGDLGTALLQTWSLLPARTRELTVLLAIHGKPVRLTTLTGLDPAWQEAAHELRPALATRVLEQDEAGRVWFHHPLIAELLVASIPEVELREQHATIARDLERLINVIGPSPERLVDLADHLAGAGDTVGCLAASRQAVDALRGSDRPATSLRLIRRCVELHAEQPGTDGGRTALLAEWAAAAAAAGSDDDEYAAVTALLALDGIDDNLVRAELLLHRRRLEFRLGGELSTSATAREAFALAEHAPESREYALALSELAHAEIIEGDPRSAEHTRDAVELATRLGDTEALSYALAGSAQLAALTRDLANVSRLAEQTFAVALPAGHFEPARLAAMWDAYSMPGYRKAAERLRGLRHRLAAAGARRLSIAPLAGMEASAWLTIGETSAVRDALRVVRAADMPDYVELTMRSISARFAALHGRVDEAEAHLDRANERFPAPPAYAALEQTVARGITSLAGGDPEGALEALMPMIEAGPGGIGSEWLVPLAARALADLATSARDGDEALTPVRSALAALDALETEHPEVIRRTMGPSYQSDLDALDALYSAERARARARADAFERWVEAADGCAVAELAWEEAYACRRGAEQGLIDGGARRRVAIALLRRGAVIARRTEADGLAAELETLARWARVRLHADRPADAKSRHLAGAPLTSREHELLPYLVDGQTYAEIAALLTISEKTVSSHVSNLLRKTGAANRVDLARMARGSRTI
ncbi:AAA family ATPase [Agromyces neolithicus]|uniref:Helix-turn-helix transcriptional regulator n=1 Tax=Agromyces neolithicus TaxID=269420 RepID=A0ABP4XZ00_9MICO